MAEQDQVGSFTFSKRPPNAVAIALNPEPVFGQDCAEIVRDFGFIARDAWYRNKKL
jgi:hypothetical protein